jgi:hypothetical protein
VQCFPNQKVTACFENWENNTLMSAKRKRAVTLKVQGVPGPKQLGDLGD